MFILYSIIFIRHFIQDTQDIRKFSIHLYCMDIFIYKYCTVNENVYLDIINIFLFLTKRIPQCCYYYYFFFQIVDTNKKFVSNEKEILCGVIYLDVRYEKFFFVFSNKNYTIRNCLFIYKVSYICFNEKYNIVFYRLGDIKQLTFSIKYYQRLKYKFI